MRKVVNNRGKKINRPLLVVGHPRCGTGYCAKLLQSAGLHILHEDVGKDGLTCWTFATKNANWLNGLRGTLRGKSRADFNFKYIIHNVRNPRSAMPSIAFTENTNKNSWNFRKRFVKVTEGASKLQQAVESYLGWNKMIEEIGPDLVIRVEDGEQKLKRFLEKRGVMKEVNFTFRNKNHNSRKNKKNYRQFTQKEWEELPSNLKEELNEFCDKYGYDRIFA